MEIGKRIYSDEVTGAILAVTGEYQGEDVTDLGIDHDFVIYQALSERMKDSVHVIQLAYREKEQDFRLGRLRSVDPITKELLFRYPDPETPGEETPPQPALSVQIAALSAENQELKTMIEDKDRENKNALFEIYSLLLGGE